MKRTLNFVIFIIALTLIIAYGENISETTSDFMLTREQLIAGRFAIGIILSLALFWQRLIRFSPSQFRYVHFETLLLGVLAVFIGNADTAAMTPTPNAMQMYFFLCMNLSAWVYWILSTAGCLIIFSAFDIPQKLSCKKKSPDPLARNSTAQ